MGVGSGGKVVSPCSTNSSRDLTTTHNRAQHNNQRPCATHYSPIVRSEYSNFTFSDAAWYFWRVSTFIFIRKRRFVVVTTSRSGINEQLACMRRDTVDIRSACQHTKAYNSTHLRTLTFWPHARWHLVGLVAGCVPQTQHPVCRPRRCQWVCACIPSARARDNVNVLDTMCAWMSRCIGLFGILSSFPQTCE